VNQSGYWSGPLLHNRLRFHKAGKYIYIFSTALGNWLVSLPLARVGTGSSTYEIWALPIILRVAAVPLKTKMWVFLHTRIDSTPNISILTKTYQFIFSPISFRKSVFPPPLFSQFFLSPRPTEIVRGALSDKVLRCPSGGLFLWSSCPLGQRSGFGRRRDSISNKRSYVQSLRIL
jgi:hypothetical protein